MTKFPPIWNALSAEFAEGEVKWRPQGGRQKIPYITARTAMNRLDAVLGPENWWDAYTPLDRGVLCSLTLRLPDGQTITKQDAGGHAGMSDSGDDEKSAYSDAFKRACAKFGVGRYLYGDGVSWHAEPPPPPPAPAPAPAPAYEASPDDGQTDPENLYAPRSGKALYAWCKEQEQRHEVALLRYVNSWGKLMEYPSRMVEWNADQVAEAFREAVRKLATITPTAKQLGEAPAPAYDPEIPNAAQRAAQAKAQAKAVPTLAAELGEYLHNLSQTRGVDAWRAAEAYCQVQGYQANLDDLTPAQVHDVYLHVMRTLDKPDRVLADPVPATGADLLEWIRSIDDADRSVEIRARSYGRRKKWPERLGDWTPAAVAEVHTLIQRVRQQSTVTTTTTTINGASHE